MRVAASTLVESLVAMTITVIIFSICIISFSTITSGPNLFKKLKVHAAIRSMAIETKQGKKFIEENRSEDEVEYYKNVEVVSPTGLLKLQIKAFDVNHKLLEDYSEYILNDSQD